MPTIKELANKVGFRGSSNHRYAEPSPERSLPVVDNSLPTQSNIRTSVDVYVTGQYVGTDGRVIEVTQRYTIFVAYAQGTQRQTMQQVRQRVLEDFQQKYGSQFNVSNVQMPDLPRPQQKTLPGAEEGGEPEPIEMYEGSDLFRRMTRTERARFEVETQRDIAETNIESIKRRFGFGEDERFA